MKRTILAFAILTVPVVAGSSPAECLFALNGKPIIDGPCDFAPLPPNDMAKKGSFQITAGDNFAIINIWANGKAVGYFNEFPGSQQPNGQLGYMMPAGACWQNDHSKICAWKPGERSQPIISATPAPPPPSSSDLRAKFTVSAIQLWRDFNDNEVAAIDKYADTVFKITGSVLSVRFGKPGLSENEQVYVEFSSSPYGDHVRAFLDQSAVDQAKGFKRGQQISLTCITAMKFYSTIDMVGCQ